MRELDKNSMYFDGMGRPLKGRVYFFVKNSTQKQNIFASNGTPLANPVYTTNGKLNPQVFLDNTDYSIVWESYVGESDMKTDEDPLSWRSAGSAISLKPEIDYDIDFAGLVCAENIEGLRNINPANIQCDMVTLLGYNEPGDKPAINYKWEGTCSESDDGAVYVRSNYSTNGRFVLVNYSDIDIRHFGVFPSEAVSSTTAEMSLQIGLAHRYAVAHSVNVYFGSADGDIGFYRLNSGTYHKFYSLDSNARFIVPDTETVNFRQCGDRPFYFGGGEGYNGTTKAIGESMRLSYALGRSTRFSWEASKKFIIDMQDQSNSVKAFDVETVSPVFEVAATTGYSFTGFSVIEGKKLPNGQRYAFIKCYVSDRMFANPDTVNWTTHVLNDCIINIENFKNVKSWISAKSTAGMKEFDFNGKTVSENVEIYMSGACNIINGNFEGTLTINCPNDVRMNNCSIHVLHVDTDCENLKMSNVETEGGYIYSQNLEMDFCNVGGIVGSAVQPIGYIHANGCTFGASIFVVLASFSGCSIKNLSIYSSNSELKYALNSNTISGTLSLMKGSSETEDYTANGTITGNTFTGQLPISCTGFYPGIVRQHNSIYNGNYGTCPKDDAVLNLTANVSSITTEGITVKSTFNDDDEVIGWTYKGIKIGFVVDIEDLVFAFGYKYVIYDGFANIELKSDVYKGERDVKSSDIIMNVPCRVLFTKDSATSLVKPGAIQASISIVDYEYTKMNSQVWVGETSRTLIPSVTFRSLLLRKTVV